MKTLEIHPPSYLSLLSIPSLENLSVKGIQVEEFDIEEDTAIRHLFTLYTDDIPEGIRNLEIQDTVISLRNFQSKVVPNLVSVKLIGQLDIEPVNAIQL